MKGDHGGRRVPLSAGRAPEGLNPTVEKLKGCVVMIASREKSEISSSLLLSFDQALCGRKADWLKLKQILAEAPELAARITTRVPVTNVLHKIAEASDDQVNSALVLARTIFRTGHRPDVPVNSLGRTPLMVAMDSLFGHLETMRLFLEFGADPNHRDRNGQSALHLIGCPVDESYLEKVRLLLSHEATPVCADTRGNTPLHCVLNESEGVKWSLAVELRHIDRRKLRGERGFDYDDLVERTQAGHEAQLSILSAVAQCLIDHGADQNARNKDGLIPLDAALTPKSPEMLRGLIAASKAEGPPHVSGRQRKGFSKNQSSGASSLASALESFPKPDLLPPASEEDLRALAAVFDGGLPEVIAELYRHHGGMKEYRGHVSMPLKTPRKALVSIKEDRLAEENKEDSSLPNDGRKYALLWSDGCENHAGIFLEPPMADRIFIINSIETFPVPAFRNVASLYRWLALEPHYTACCAGRLWDYPSMRREDEDPADGDISKKLIAQWEDGGRTDIYPVMFALYLSSCEDNGQWTDILESIIYSDDNDIQLGLGGALCAMLGRRDYEPAVEVLYMAALNGHSNMQSAAIFALKEMGGQSSRRALREIQKRLRANNDVHILHLAFRDSFPPLFRYSENEAASTPS